MSDFVNYDKRDINLPPGCKNLIDVLQPMVPPPGLKPRRGLTMGGGETATISSIPKYINNFLNQSNQDLLLIRTPNEKVGFELRRLVPEKIWASVSFIDGPPHAARARELFARYELDVPPLTETPAQFVPGAPVWEVLSIHPFPPNTACLIEIATAVFRELSNATENTQLDFHYYRVE